MRFPKIPFFSHLKTVFKRNGPIPGGSVYSLMRRFYALPKALFYAYKIAKLPPTQHAFEGFSFGYRRGVLSLLTSLSKASFDEKEKIASNLIALASSDTYRGGKAIVLTYAFMRAAAEERRKDSSKMRAKLKALSEVLEDIREKMKETFYSSDLPHPYNYIADISIHNFNLAAALVEEGEGKPKLTIENNQLKRIHDKLAGIYRFHSKTGFLNKAFNSSYSYEVVLTVFINRLSELQKWEKLDRVLDLFQALGRLAYEGELDERKSQIENLINN